MKSILTTTQRRSIRKAMDAHYFLSQKWIRELNRQAKKYGISKRQVKDVLAGFRV